MARRQSRTKKNQRVRETLSAVRLWLLIIALVLVIVIGVAELFSSGRAGVIRERLFGKRDLTERAERLDAAVDGAIVRMRIAGVTNERTERDTLGYVTPHWDKQGTVPSGTSIYQTNLEITKAVVDAGGILMRGEERDPDRDGLRVLELRFGLGDVETHRITLDESGRGLPPATREEHERPRLAIIIDDFGYNMSELARGFLALDAPLTIAVLPSCPRTSDIANAAHQAGKHVIAHIPMQPESYPQTNPGDGALLESHTAEELRRLTKAAIEDVPYARGANNHMGSRLTTRPAHMRAVMSELKAHGFFFVDSVTTAGTVAYDVARGEGIPSARNTLFLDSYRDESGNLDVESRLAALEDEALRHGVAIGIGHPKRETLEALERRLPEMAARGIDVVFVDELVE